MHRNKKDGNTPQCLSSIKPQRSKSRHGKRKSNENNDNQKDLPELTSELHELIIKRLDVVSFCASGAVCKSWLEFYHRYREDFMESQAPMVVLTSSQAQKTCYLYDIANGKTKEVKMPKLVGKYFVGCSGGYVIMEGKRRRIYFVNPITRHRQTCCVPPFTFRGKCSLDHIIYASTLSYRNYVIVAISNNKHEYKVFHSRTGDWFDGMFYGEKWLDMAIFKHQVYIITNKAHLLKLSLKIADSKTLMEVRNTPNADSLNLKLVVSDNQLLMVDFIPEMHLNIHKMDFDAMEWVKLESLGDQSLFIGGKLGSGIRKPDRWGGRSNCVYHLETESTMCYIYSMEAKLIENFSLVKNSTTSEFSSHGWYYPHQCMKVDYVEVD